MVDINSIISVVTINDGLKIPSKTECFRKDQNKKAKICNVQEIIFN